MTPQEFLLVCAVGMGMIGTVRWPKIERTRGSTAWVRKAKLGAEHHVGLGVYIKLCEGHNEMDQGKLISAVFQVRGIFQFLPHAVFLLE